MYKRILLVMVMVLALANISYAKEPNMEYVGTIKNTDLYVERDNYVANANDLYCIVIIDNKGNGKSFAGLLRIFDKDMKYQVIQGALFDKGKLVNEIDKPLTIENYYNGSGYDMIAKHIRAKK